jgi:hypothetical protein
MGYYLQTKEDLNKADQLLAEHPEVQEVDQSSLRFDKTRNTVLVCVVQNGPFDAAGICHSWAQMRAFATLGGPPKRWLLFPRDLVLKLNPEVERLLARRPIPKARARLALALYRSEKVLPSDLSFCPPGGKCAYRFLLYSDQNGYEFATWDEGAGEFCTKGGRSALLDSDDPFLWAPLPDNP